MKLLLTGHNGYLCGAIKKKITHDYVTTENILNRTVYPSVNMILHFAGPSDDYDFKNEANVISSIIDGTKNMIEIAKDNNAWFVFASTLGVLQPNNLYTCCKFVVEKYIECHYYRSMILRIPRVYSRCRKKGLMKKLRRNEVPEKDMNHVVEYLHLGDFVDQTIPIIDNPVPGIVSYNNLKTDTIQGIKQKFIL